MSIVLTPSQQRTGLPHARVLAQPLVVNDAIDAVRHAGAGAVVVMLGTVRNHTPKNGRSVRVARLDYEAYAAMAVKVIGGILDEASERWPDVRAAVDHRTGTLAIGDIAVVVATSAPHRREAFAACEYVIQRLKEDAPIWKREQDEDGMTWVGLGP